MKLSVLFAKFLYQHKELNLPGIGTFSIDPNIVTPEPSDKSFAEYVQQIKYTQRTVTRPDDAFIDFIRAQTGKIRPLAESDLDSFLSDGKILLNIGKPFYFEGIGSLLKNRQGKYDFTPGLPLVDRGEVLTADKIIEKKADTLATPEQGFRAESNATKKMLVTVSLIAGIIAVIWGGYYLYSRSQTNTADEPLSQSSEPIVVDSFEQAQSAPDTTLMQTTVPENTGTYRYVIENTSSKSRALKRYAQLKSYFLDIRMDANTDSSMFKLYFVMPSSSDSTRVKDSLARMYGRRVIVEK